MWSVVSVVIAAVAIPTHAAFYDVPVALAFVFGLLLGGSVLLSAVLPWWGAGAQAAAVVGFSAASTVTGGPWPMPVIGMIAFCFVLVVLGVHGRWRIGGVLWLAVIVLLTSSALVAATFGEVAAGAFADLIVTASTSALALFSAAMLAQLVDARVEVREAREETEAERAHVLWQQERARIAREMHDVVAHSMSIVHMRATSARYRIEGLDADAAAEFDGIAEQARAALREMRGLLGVLREGDGVLDAPQPGLADLPALIAATRDAGVAITASLPAEGDGDGEGAERLAELPASLQLALYRVAQESLSNVVRHAHGAEVFVGLERVGPELWLTIENGPGDGEPAEGGAASDQGGHGIRGMRERMASVGGTLDDRPLAGGGYRVVARAPYPGAGEEGTA